MCENQNYLCVGFDEVVDPDAFRDFAIHAELGLPADATEGVETDWF